MVEDKVDQFLHLLVELGFFKLSLSVVDWSAAGGTARWSFVFPQRHLDFCVAFALFGAAGFSVSSCALILLTRL